MKKILIAILSLFLLGSIFAPFAVYADDGMPDISADGLYQYALDGFEGVYILKYEGNETIVTVPAEIDGYRVYAIDYAAFRNCSQITSLTLSEGIKEIKFGAFSNCRNLKSVSLPDSLVRIDSYAFEYCDSLNTINIPNNVSYLSAYGSIWDGTVFKNCSQMQEITVASENETFTAINGILYDKAGRLLYCPQGKLGKATIPFGVNHVFQNAFSGCKYLSEIIFPADFKGFFAEDNNNMFSGCDNLCSITFLNNTFENLSENYLSGIPNKNNLTVYALENSIAADYLKEQAAKDGFHFHEIEERAPQELFVTAWKTLNGTDTDITLSIQNNSDTAKQAALFAAGYHNSRMCTAKSAGLNIDISAKETKLFTLSLADTSVQDEIRIFLWNTYNELIPLCDVTEAYPALPNTPPALWQGTGFRILGRIVQNENVSVGNTSASGKKGTVAVKILGNFGDIYSPYQIGETYDFSVGKTDAYSLIGRAAELFVNSNSISAIKISGADNAVSFPLHCYDNYGVNDCSEINELLYLKAPTDWDCVHAKIQHHTESTPVTVIHNGVQTAYSDLKKKYFGGSNPLIDRDCKLNGKITLIDTDKISGADIILIETADVAVVDNVNGNIVTFAHTSDEIPSQIDFENITYSITKNGSPLNYNELNKGDVLSVIYSSTVPNVYTMRIITDKVQGVISALKVSNTSANGYSCKIDSKDYEVAQGAYNMEKLTVSATGTFYVNEYGKIVAFFEGEAVIPEKPDEIPDIGGEIIVPSASMSVINSISHSVNDVGDEIYVVEYYQNGEKRLTLRHRKYIVKIPIL